MFQYMIDRVCPLDAAGRADTFLRLRSILYNVLQKKHKRDVKKKSKKTSKKLQNKTSKTKFKKISAKQCTK